MDSDSHRSCEWAMYVYFRLKSSFSRIQTGSMNGFSDFLGWLLPSYVEFYEIRLFLIWSSSISVNSQEPSPAGWFPSLLQGKWLGECFPEGGESYSKEAELCQISKNFYKYLTRNWERRRFSNQSAKLRSLILALQPSALFMESLCWQFPCVRRGSGEETDKIAAGEGKNCLAPVAPPPASSGALLRPGLFPWREGAVSCSALASSTRTPLDSQRSRFCGLPQFVTTNTIIKSKLFVRERRKTLFWT